MLKLNKFYRYLIYRVSHFENLTPVMNTLATLCVVHGSLISTFFLLLYDIFGIKGFADFNKTLMSIVTVLFLVLHYLLFYNKKKWKEYEKEFKDETLHERRTGLVKVLAYLIGCILIFFVYVLVGAKIRPYIRLV